MIEVKVPKDIRKYEARLIGPLTTRQTICFVCSCVVGLGIYGLIDFLPKDMKIIIILFFMAPFILCGWFKPYGMHFERFVQTAFVSTVLAPANRKYITYNAFANETMQKTQDKNNNKKKQEPKHVHSKGSPKIRVLNWILTYIACLIPVLNIPILLGFMIIAKSTTKKNWAVANLIMQFILIAIITASILLTGISLNDIINLIGGLNGR